MLLNLIQSPGVLLLAGSIIVQLQPCRAVGVEEQKKKERILIDSKYGKRTLQNAES
jgi:hypothetical protein